MRLQISVVQLSAMLPKGYHLLAFIRLEMCLDLQTVH